MLAERARREQGAGVRKRDEGVAGLLPGPEIEQADFAPAETNGHPAIEGHVGQHELDLGRVEAALSEPVDAARHLLRLNARHDARGFLLGDEGRAELLEHDVAHVVIAMEMAVDHPFDRLVGDLADAREQIAPLARVRAGVDQQHAVIGDEEDGVRAVEVEQEVEVGGDLLDHDLGRCAVLGSGGWCDEENAGKDRGHDGCDCRGDRKPCAERVEAKACHADVLPGFGSSISASGTS